MPWIPTTDFEEEVVNLQPHHDFIYGVLSEPEYSYPRPKSHTEYAVSKRNQITEHQQNKQPISRSQMNGKLYTMQQVQRMAGTKPIGEQATVDDWENNAKIEQETIGMMRYCGMGVSVEQPLNQKVTIATYPVENTIKMVRNGRRKVALYFDDNVFKLKEKVSDTSSSFESANNGVFNDKCSVEQKCECNTEADDNSSIASNSTFSSTSFSTAGEINDSFSPLSHCKTYSSTQIQAERLLQYEKLLEETAVLSLNSSTIGSSSCQQKNDSFQTAEDISCWKPISEEDENIFAKQENWPVLYEKRNSNTKSKNKNLVSASFTENLLSKTNSDSISDGCSEASSNSSRSKRTNFLSRFIKTDNSDTPNTSTSSRENTSNSLEPTTYATIAKTPKTSTKSSPKPNITNFPTFYSTRRLYELKRQSK